MPRVLVVGSANVDLTMGVERLPAPGETVSGGTFLQAMGGKGANQAVAARRAGADVTFVTCVGVDAHGDAVLQAMRAEGIDLTGTSITEAAATGVALILSDRHGENSIAVAPGANFHLHLTPALAAIASLQHGDLLVLQNELAPATTAALLAAARGSNASVLLNAAPAERLSVDALAGENFHLVVNEHEAATLLGRPAVTRDDGADAATLLLQQGFRLVVITLGSLGCCVATEEETFLQEALPVTAVDATGAGDTFCGALAAALVANKQPLSGEQLRTAIRFATVAASLATTRHGAQPSIPVRLEIDAAEMTW